MVTPKGLVCLIERKVLGISWVKESSSCVLVNKKRMYAAKPVGQQERNVRSRMKQDKKRVCVLRESRLVSGMDFKEGLVIRNRQKTTLWQTTRGVIRGPGVYRSRETRDQKEEGGKEGLEKGSRRVAAGGQENDIIRRERDGSWISFRRTMQRMQKQLGGW